MKLKRLETYFLEIIKNRRKGFFPSIIKIFLRFSSWVFRLFVGCRNWAFDRGWLCSYSPPVPLVISIGNIVLGGTGKTPVTLMLAKEFYSDFSIAILSRGYRSSSERLNSPVWLSKGEGPMHPASVCGDEPFLLAQNLPKALVVVGRDRHKASIMAAQVGAQMILLDDGMQHRRLARDLEIVVMNACDLFGQGYLFPRGFLREDLKSLSRAHMIVLNHVESPEHFAIAKQKVARYTGASIIGTKTHVKGIFDFKGEKINSIHDKRIGMFCGIAHPDYFEHTLRNEGARIISRLIVSDHYHFDLNALDRFASSCQKMGIELLLCTEKDRVKFSGSLKLALPTAWLQMGLTIVDGEAEWANFIKRAKNDILGLTP